MSEPEILSTANEVVIAEEALSENNVAEEDTMPHIMIGLNALLSTVWWLVLFFVYVQTTTSDRLTPVYPIAWLWTNLNDTSMGWVAISYFTTVLSYFMVSFIELLAWFIYLIGDPGLMIFWTPVFGMWGGIILYILPWLFAIFHLTFDTNDGGIAVGQTSNGFNNDLFLIVGGGFFWLYSLLVHFAFTNRFLAHAATIKQPCICRDYPPLEKGANDDQKAKYKAMLELECEKQCPTDLFCPLTRGIGMSQTEYDLKCDYLMVQIKKENTKKMQTLREIVNREEVIIYDEEDPIASDIPDENERW
jgi:hypothetical protein